MVLLLVLVLPVLLLWVVWVVRCREVLLVLLPGEFCVRRFVDVLIAGYFTTSHTVAIFQSLFFIITPRYYS